MAYETYNNTVFLHRVILSRKKLIPIIIAHKGVSALNIEASELSIFISAKQYKNAGKKLPSNPDITTTGILFFGTRCQPLKAKGNNTRPALKILIEATCHAVKCCMPIFIKIKELPHIKQSKP